VLEAAAVGVASGYEADDEIKLYAVAASELEPLELLEHLVAHLPHYMVPRYIEFVSELPRTPTNKVRKTYLRELGVTEATWDRKTAAVSIREIARAQEGAGA
jgi:crotonobetaine/carnitine-CoA ligase